MSSHPWPGQRPDLKEPPAGFLGQLSIDYQMYFFNLIQSRNLAALTNGATEIGNCFARSRRSVDAMIRQTLNG
jgi:hypothetical protein